MFLWDVDGLVVVGGVLQWPKFGTLVCCDTMCRIMTCTVLY